MTSQTIRTKFDSVFDTNEPIRIQCPNCQMEGQTRVEKKASSL